MFSLRSRARLALGALGPVPKVGEGLGGRAGVGRGQRQGLCKGPSRAVSTGIQAPGGKGLFVLIPGFPGAAGWEIPQGSLAPGAWAPGQNQSQVFAKPLLPQLLSLALPCAQLDPQSPGPRPLSPVLPNLGCPWRGECIESPSSAPTHEPGLEGSGRHHLLCPVLPSRTRAVFSQLGLQPGSEDH